MKIRYWSSVIENTSWPSCETSASASGRKNALRTSEERLRLVLDTLPAAAYTCDTDGVITYFNESASDLWGASPNSTTSRIVPVGRSGVFTGRMALRFVKIECCWMAMETKEGRTVHSNEIVIERPDGHRRSVLAYANRCGITMTISSVR